MWEQQDHSEVGAMAGRGRTGILILGGGCRGVNTARALQKALKDQTNVEIAMVHKANYTVFQSRLAEVISGSRRVLDTAVPIRDPYLRVTHIC